MIQVDNRLGGCPRYIVVEEPIAMTVIPPEILKCVVFVEVQKIDGSFHVGGTAFFVGLQLSPDLPRGVIYAFTAKHVITRIKDKGVDKVWLRVNFLDGQFRHIETNLGDWILHPDPVVDVAMYPNAVLTDETDHRVISVNMFATEELIAKEKIGPGEEVFFTGLFVHHHGRQKNIPVVRTGNIAAMPDEPVQMKHGRSEAYLIEARSIGGLSGSPVFAHLGLVRMVDGEVRHASPSQGQGKRTGIGPHYLLGLMSGHYDADGLPDQDFGQTEDLIRERERVNMGIAIVVPVSKLTEMIDAPNMKETRKQIEQAMRDQSAPVMDSAIPEDEFTKEDFEDALKRVSRKIQPSQSDEGKLKT